MTENVFDQIGKFTWDFGANFFIETPIGNFIWSDPDYNGNHTLTPTDKSYKSWMRKGYWGRDRGEHVIRKYTTHQGKLPKLMPKAD